MTTHLLEKKNDETRKSSTGMSTETSKFCYRHTFSKQISQLTGFMMYQFYPKINYVANSYLSERVQHPIYINIMKQYS
jgi:hypothetical protein